MAFLSNLLGKTFDARGAQGIQGTSNSTQGVQGIQGIQGTAGLSNGTLLTNPQPGVYTLQSSDVGKVVSGVSTVGIPSDVFNPGENVVILNNDLSSTFLDIEGTSPVVSIYESGVGVALTENKRIKNKSFISLFCTRLNEFIVGGNLFNIAIDATGGTIIDEGGYRIHVFTGTGPFNVTSVPPASSTVEYLVVAGGGGVPSGYEGGGGAGGFRTGTGFPVTVQDYTITVGAGGLAGPSNGGDSVFSTITSAGGGRGGLGNGVSGGSGSGGGTPNSLGGAGNTPPVSPPQGNPGGNGNGPTFSGEGGGGGGAGTAGSPSPGAIGGNGGDGLPVSWVPASYGTPGPAPGRWFAGGGGGGSAPAGGTGLSSGGAGGGGNGGGRGGGTPGAINTGGGGGSTNVSGGSGIVIIRYPI